MHTWNEAIETALWVSPIIVPVVILALISPITVAIIIGFLLGTIFFIVVIAVSVKLFWYIKDKW